MWRRDGRVDQTFLYLSLALLLTGLAFLASASGPTAYHEHGSSFYFLRQQIIQGVLPGLFMGYLAYRFPHTVWRTYAFPMLIVSIVLLVLVFIPGIGTDLNTFAKSWIKVGSYFTFQPTEVVKLTFLFYLAAWMESRGHGVSDLKEGLAPFLGTLGVISALIFLQPDLGTLSVILAMAFIVYYTAGASLSHLLAVGATGVILFLLAIQISSHAHQRVETFLHPELDPKGSGWQINQALLATGSGGLIGRGFGHSIQKFSYLPEVIGDSIFAIMAEELGFIFSAGFLALFVAWLWRGLKIAQDSADGFSRYVMIGCLASIGVQAFVNIASITGLMPLTGVTLPFVSYGGTSMLMTLFSVGLMLNISRS